MVAARLADVFEIVMLPAGANTFLHRYRTLVRNPAPTGENILELVHPRVDKQKRGIIQRNNRRRYLMRVSACFVKVYK